MIDAPPEPAEALLSEQFADDLLGYWQYSNILNRPWAIPPYERRTASIVPKTEWRQRRAEGKMAALAFVNDVRRQMGLRPVDALVKGVAVDAVHCVIARSIQDGDGFTTVTYDNVRSERRVFFGLRTRVVSRATPPLVAQFLAWFDMDHYPELVKQGD